jgi:uncharacterized protein
VGCFTADFMKSPSGESGHPARGRWDGKRRRVAQHRLKFRRLQGRFAILRLAPDAATPEWATKGEFTSITRTADELSVVCLIENLPPDVQPSHRWTCLKLEGPFPFEMTGVLQSFIAPLSQNGVPILAISTFDTDYVLIQEEFTRQALDLLGRAGHEVLS